MMKDCLGSVSMTFTKPAVHFPLLTKKKLSRYFFGMYCTTELSTFDYCIES